MITIPRLSPRLLVLSLFLLTTALQAQTPSLSQILSNDRLWGKDFPAALASLKAWQAAGAGKVIIMSDRVISGTAYPAPQPAEAALGKFMQMMREAPPKPQPQFEKLVAPPPAEQFQGKVIAFGEDNSQRVVWIAPSATLLAPDLTMEQVKAAIGQPQKVTRQVIQGRGDRRPLEMTLYSYANGAVVFAESNYSSPSDAVNRVYLDVPAANRVLFK